MMTTSANIAGVPTPFAPVPREGAWPYSKKKVWHIDELKPGKKPKKGDKLYYGQVGMLLLQRSAAESKQLGEAKVEEAKSAGSKKKRAKAKLAKAKNAVKKKAAKTKKAPAEGEKTKAKDTGSDDKVKSPQVTDKPGKTQDKYEYKGKVGVWRTIAGKRYFFPDDGTSSIPPMPKKVKKELGPDADDAVKAHKRTAKQVETIIAGLKDQMKAAKGEGKTAKVSRLKQQIKDIEKGGIGAAKALAASKTTFREVEKKGGKKVKEVEKIGDWADYAEDKILPKVQALMKKAKARENKAAFGVLQKMEAAIKKGDQKAFEKASAALKKTVKKIGKKVEKQKKKEAKEAGKFKPLVLGKFFGRKK